MAIDAVQILGFCAAAVSVPSFVPQAWKIIKSREIKGLSARMYALTAVSFTPWLMFGVAKQEWALIIAKGVCLVAALFILAMITVPAKTRSEIATKLDRGR